MAGQPLLSWRIQNAASDVADVDIFDVIGDPWGDGVQAADFVQQLRGLDASTIRLHINSPGGYIADALAMFAAVQSHPARIEGYVTGIAASSASFLLQAADWRVVAKNSSILIHDGHALAMGDAATFRALADELDEASDNIASIYAERAGGTVAEWRERMRAGAANHGTNYRGEAAVEIGLADEVGVVRKENRIPNRIAALAENPEPPDTNNDLAAQFREALSAARLEKPAPSLSQLLEQSKKPITTSLKDG